MFMCLVGFPQKNCNYFPILYSGDDNLKATIPNRDYDRSKTAGDCKVFQISRKHDNKRHKMHTAH